MVRPIRRGEALGRREGLRARVALQPPPLGAVGQCHRLLPERVGEAVAKECELRVRRRQLRRHPADAISESVSHLSRADARWQRAHRVDAQLACAVPQRVPIAELAGALG